MSKVGDEMIWMRWPVDFIILGEKKPMKTTGKKCKKCGKKNCKC